MVVIRKGDQSMQPQYVGKNLLQRRVTQLINKNIVLFPDSVTFVVPVSFCKFVICCDLCSHFRKIFTFVPNFVCVILYSFP